MKFDFAILNPPYNGAMHLQFLKKCISISDYSISIQPTTWINDAIAKYKKHCNYKKYEESISKHIKTLDIYDSFDAFDKFNIFIKEIGIFECNATGGYDYDFSDTIIDKMINKLDVSYQDVMKNKVPMNCVVPCLISGTDSAPAVPINENTIGALFNKTIEKSIYKDGLNLFYNITYKEYKKTKGWGNCKERTMTQCIDFNTVDECKNFINCSHTKLYRYFIRKANKGLWHNFKMIPFLGDYTHPWTDEMLYEYFNITDEEIERIEKFIDKFKIDKRK